ncbi:bifunctional UDP-N-acetylglucosamine diphosphorylase/glucosamine-1-phosphate N-acetyltransferase GlmU [Fangia hongkongensis]|uniref:bifunctional UDP-N-acetylglucosamine diphosphorylase/glucosamine-1-phosphate N-acetyltransferase GlmU n=1 Tax=Fangia hongkongensis TaxID=270495 RepID=UPI00037D41FA|nr:bifunctional UDP-N-acetylglucosamine diphosphorylase/glucosamine-1-phosphate N-acetyltransferase GlmU [Fangia hongkongensis]MBK2123826.1 bifunctional UDP-N-acetylglucosamine diphosphorylase/glucosamine-1-phosphate N-acetyltransferase GlmU [Fangia hongkongensis]
MALSVIILAAGKGSRMCSKKSKVLQTLAGKSLIRHVVDSVEALNADNIIIIYGHLGDQVQQELDDKKITWVEQTERLGTGHAVLQALPKVKKKDQVLILYGDVPLISEDTLSHLIDVTKEEDLGILTANVDNPAGLGRIIRNRFGEIEAIVEDKDASDIQKQIHEINTGIYCVSGRHLHEWLPKLQNKNVQKEYYLTDIVEMAEKEKVTIKAAHPVNNFEILGVNTREQLAKLERVWQRSIALEVMDKGVSLADPARFDVRGEIEVGEDTWIDINVLVKGKVTIGSNCVIGANCILKDCTIEDNVKIKPNTIIDGAVVKSYAVVGPFARVRPESTLEEKAHVGNFVEVKKTIIGKGSKANHLTYLGDSVIGEGCNIGAGVITCNYDGVNKHQTIIGNDVFVGSDCQLIAPVSIGNGANIGAGSTITKNVPEHKLTVNRANKQMTLSSWQRPKKKEKV